MRVLLKEIDTVGFCTKFEMSVVLIETLVTTLTAFSKMKDFLVSYSNYRTILTSEKSFTEELNSYLATINVNGFQAEQKLN